MPSVPQIQVGLDIGQLQQGQLHAVESCQDQSCCMTSLMPRCLSTASGHLLQARGRSLLPASDAKIVGRFCGELPLSLEGLSLGSLALL